MRRAVLFLANHGGNPLWIGGEISFCIVWVTLGLDLVALTTALSVLALTLARAIMFKQDEDAAQSAQGVAAIQAKLDEILTAMAGARSELAHLEDKPIDEIERLRP